MEMVSLPKSILVNYPLLQVSAMVVTGVTLAGVCAVMQKYTSINENFLC